MTPTLVCARSPCPDVPDQKPPCPYGHLCSSNNGAGEQRCWERTGCNKAHLFCCLECFQLDKQDPRCFSGGRRQISAALLLRLCVCLFQQGSVWVVGGRMVILSPQMDRKNPGGIWGATGDVVFTVCACVCVFVRFWREVFWCCGRGVCGLTPFLCNKCHPCRFGLPSKSSDLSDAKLSHTCARANSTDYGSRGPV